MSVEHHPRPSGGTGGGADHHQAGYFRDELERELEALDERSEQLHVQLAEHLRCNRQLEIFRAQGELRSVTLARRSVVDMLAALARRFVGDTSN